MSFSLRKLSDNKFYSCLKCCVYFRSEEELNKHLELCSVHSQKYVGKKAFHKDDYLKFDYFPFFMVKRR